MHTHYNPPKLSWEENWYHDMVVVENPRPKHKRSMTQAEQDNQVYESMIYGK